MRIESEIKLDYSDVLLRPKRSTLTSRSEVLLSRQLSFYHSPKKWQGVPIIASNMLSCGTFEMAKILAEYKIITALHKFYSLEDYKRFLPAFDQPDFIAFTLGIRDQDSEKLDLMIKHKLIDKFSFLCIDVPNGYVQKFSDFVRTVRQKCPQHIIIAGNVVTNEMTEEIILNGADIIKVGIGPGSVCTTRTMTGVGYPQLSAVIECADAAHGISNSQGGGLIIADGGQRQPSCIAKAYCGGADFNMCGNMFSGFEESGGKTVIKDGKTYKEYFGLSSNQAMEMFYGKKEPYRAAEGKTTLLEHRGGVRDFLHDLFGSLRSTGTYIGARSLKEFSKRATFIRVNYPRFTKD